MGRKPLNFCSQTIFWQDFHCRKCLSKNANFAAVKPLITGKLRAQLKFWAPIISYVGNLQLFVGFLSEIWSVCRKIATYCPAHFINPRRRCQKVMMHDRLMTRYQSDDTDPLNNNWQAYQCHKFLVLLLQLDVVYWCKYNAITSELTAT